MTTSSMKVLAALLLLSGCTLANEEGRKTVPSEVNDNTPPSRRPGATLTPEEAGAIVVADGERDPSTTSSVKAGATSPAPERDCGTVKPLEGGAPKPSPPGFVIESEGGWSTVLDPHSDICTRDGEALTFSIVNESEAPIRLAWGDVDCDFADYGEIAPGEALLQATYTNHRWRVTEGGATHDFVLDTPGASYAITVR